VTVTPPKTPTENHSADGAWRKKRVSPKEPRQKRNLSSNAREKILTISRISQTKMSPGPQSEVWVTDSEDEIEHCVTVPARVLRPQTGTLLIRQLKHLSDRLFKSRPRGNARPKLGQMCLIMKGKAGCDEGQLGIVSDRTSAMVRVTYAKDRHGEQTSKLKRPSSLIMVDSRLTLIQEKDGTIWLRPLVECNCGEHKR
jgi:hypothetical protein